MSHLPLTISLIALLVALWTASEVTLRRSAPMPPPGLSRAWGRDVIGVLYDLDQRLIVIERRVVAPVDGLGCSA